MRPGFVIPTVLMFALSVIACATPVRPASVAPFEGQWQGQWRNVNNEVGGVEVNITRFNDHTVMMTGRVYWVGGELGVSRPLELRNGELSTMPGAPFSQILTLYGENRLQGEYHWITTGGRGSWYLTRSRSK